MKTSFCTELLLRMDRSSDLPLHVQLERQMRVAIQTGQWVAGAKLPATRSLAADLGVARGVVVEAYEQLIAEGYLTSAAGSGTRVATIRPAVSKAPTAASTKQDFLFDFVAGSPDSAEFPRRAWLACLTRAVNAASTDLFGYPESRGLYPARTAVATFLARSRATVGDAEQTMICNGFTQGINLIARALKSVGVKRVAIEDPSFGMLARQFASVGLDVQCVPLDERGLIVDRLGDSVTAVVVTPAHQFPTGAAMTADRRAALLEWAERRDAWIVEDDYDSEFRYDREPLGALQGLAPHRVVYMGTASKTLAPGLRLGWMLVPPTLVDEFIGHKRAADAGSPAIDQVALAEFLESGEMDRHLRRMRPIYRQRRDVLTAALTAHLPDLRVHGVSAGLHLMIDLPAGADELAIVEQAAQRSVRVVGSSQYLVAPRAQTPALILGYGCIAEESIEDGIRRLADVIRGREPAGSRPRTAASRWAGEPA